MNLFKKVNDVVDRSNDDPNTWKDFIRASDQMPCEICKELLWKHGQPLKEICPTMIEDCAGKWWKT